MSICFFSLAGIPGNTSTCIENGCQRAYLLTANQNLLGEYSHFLSMLLFSGWTSRLGVRQCSRAVKTQIWESVSPKFEAWPSGCGQESLATQLTALWIKYRRCENGGCSCLDVNLAQCMAPGSPAHAPESHY